MKRPLAEQRHMTKPSAGPACGNVTRGIWFDPAMDPGLHPPIPILRMFDLDATRRFYLDYLGCTLDWEEGGDGSPAFMQVSRGPLVLNLSSHHGDGTPGGVVLVFVDDVEALHAELHAKEYPFLKPGLEPHGVGRELVLLDPASNQIRFFERRRGLDQE